MTRSSDSLVSPFVDGELSADETSAGGLPRILGASPFVSLELAQRRPAPAVEAPLAEAPPAAESPRAGEATEEAEASLISELAPEAPEALEEPASTEVSTEISAEASTEIAGFETEAEASAIEEVGEALEGELDSELRDALELELEAGAEEAEETRDAEAGADELEKIEEENKKPLGIVTVVLDQPSEADDTFTLQSKDGSYRKTLGPRNAQPLVAGEKVLRFEGVDTTKEYKLCHNRSSARAERRIFPPTYFVGLTEHHTARRPKALYPDFRSQAPQVTSGQPVDPLLVDPSPGLVHLTDVRA